MKEKGFTLIELLAVIVILAIIALIAVPIILNIIEDARKESNERSVELYASAIKNAIAKEQLNGKIVPAGKYSTTTLPFEVEYEGNVDCEEIEIKESGSVSLAKCTVNGTEVDYTYGKEETVAKTYANGEEVYFDVENGIGCTKADYEKSYGTATVSAWDDNEWGYVNIEVTDYLNSLTGYNGLKNSTNYGTPTETEKLEKQNSCLKFYAFNDDGGNTVNLLLDHNTTDLVAWNSSYSTVDGPSELTTRLASDTGSWAGTETPASYTIDQSGVSSKANYTVNYNKARLITAEEIAQITGHDTWDVLNESSSWYYFDSLSTSASATCKSGNTSGCQYGWLYDRTSKTCTTYGCLNNTQSGIYGYWTVSPYATYSDDAWYVVSDGRLNGNDVVDDFLYGVRPVITVLKSKLS